MTQGIYGMFDSEECCLYVGQSTDVEARWSAHKRKLANGVHHNHSLQEWVDSMGLDSLVFRLLEEVVDGAELADKENEWFERLTPKFWGRRPGPTWRWNELSEQTLERMNQKRAEKRRERLAILNAEWGEKCKELYMAGVTMEKIAQKLPIPYSAVRRTLRAQGIRARTGRDARGLQITEERYLQAKQALADNAPLTELAAQWGCSLTTVKQLLTEMDLWISRSTKAVTALYALSSTEIAMIMSDGKSDGLSTREIADRLGVSRSTLIRAYKKSIS